MNSEKRCAGNTLASELHVLNYAQQRRYSGQRTGRGRNDRRLCKILEHRTSNEVVHKILARGERHALFDWKQYIEPAKLFRLRDRIASLKMKNGLSLVVLAEPASLQRGKARLFRPSAATRAKKNFRQSCQSFGKVCEELSSHFAFIAAGPENPRDNHPTLGFGAQSSSISSV